MNAPQASHELLKSFSVTYDLCQLLAGKQCTFDAMVAVSIRTQDSCSTAATLMQRLLPCLSGPTGGVEFDERQEFAKPTVWTLSFTAASVGRSVSLSDAKFGVSRRR